MESGLTDRWQRHDMLSQILKKVIRKTDLRISRGANKPIQFDDTESTLRNLKRMGFCPKCIIDGGAHLGSFAKMARDIFPETLIYMVEPQKACTSHLVKLTNADNLMRLDVCLLAKSTMESVQFIDDGDTPSTGARAAPAGLNTGRLVSSKTLDVLFSQRLDYQNNLLKLDLQGHELEALDGAKEILKNKIDFAIIETSCFVEHSEPKSLAIIQVMNDNGFDIFDIAAMGRRSRDKRLRQMDIVFIRREAAIFGDRGWE